MSQQRNIFGYRIANQRFDFRYPLQVIVDAHRPAHENQPGISRSILRDGIARIDSDQLPRDFPSIEEIGKVAGAFYARMAKDGDGFHIRIEQKSEPGIFLVFGP